MILSVYKATKGPGPHRPVIDTSGNYHTRPTSTTSMTTSRMWTLLPPTTRPHGSRRAGI